MEARITWEWNDDQWQTALGRSAQERMATACISLERDIKANFGRGNTPGVVTGRLKSSITSNWTGKKHPGRANEFGDPAIGSPGGGWPIIRGVVGTNVKYAKIHEYGGTIKPKRFDKLYIKDRFGNITATAKEVKIPARPFLRPALERNRKNINRIFYDI